jgi:hypothetical protein
MVIANLAAGPEEQADYLDRIFVHCTGGGSAAAYGNDELALELDDILLATDHMIEFGELSADELATIRELSEHFDAFWKPKDPSFWTREALFDDRRWQGVRDLAARVLRRLPDEARDSDYTRGLSSDGAPPPDTPSLKRGP